MVSSTNTFVSSRTRAQRSSDRVDRVLSENIGPTVGTCLLLAVGGVALHSAGYLDVPTIIVGGACAAVTIFGCVGAAVTEWLGD